MKRVLIIGATGVFGQRLAKHVSRWGDVVLFVSSRRMQKAKKLAQQLRRACNTRAIHAVALDHTKNLNAVLEDIKPFIVVDCSGPFQMAGFDTAKAAIQSGAHFVDLADARNYLAGFAPALHQSARKRGVVALSGASSTPALSGCVVEALTKGWHRIDTIDIAITPGGKSDVGRSVIEAILSYAGQEIPIWQSGQLQTCVGWRGGHWIDIAQLGKRRAAHVETFDAEYLGAKHNVQSRVSFSAGLESPIEQYGLEALARLRQSRLAPALQRIIPLLLHMRRITRIPTSDTGAMVVDISGLDDVHAHARKRWTLVARQGQGPAVPILPAAALVHQIMHGPVLPGARLAVQELTLEKILQQAAPYAITCMTDTAKPAISLPEEALEPVQDGCA